MSTDLIEQKVSTSSANEQPAVFDHQLPGAPAYNRDQLKAVLEYVAGVAHTINDILMMAQTSEEPWECARLVNAAQALVQNVGSAADMAMGETIIGGFARWNYGPVFDGLGKASEA